MSPYFSLAITAMASEGSDGRELASLGPPSHGLGIYPEQSSYFRRREEPLAVLRILTHGLLPLFIFEMPDACRNRSYLYVRTLGRLWP